MSEIIEKLADFKVFDSQSGKELFNVSAPNTMPFGKLMRLHFIFFNLRSEHDYSLEVLVDGTLTSITTVNIPDRHLNYIETVDGVKYGKTQGDFDFSLARRDYGAFKVECVLYDGKKEKHRIEKYFSFEEEV